jgi:hypothetical protein
MNHPMHIEDTKSGESEREEEEACKNNNNDFQLLWQKCFSNALIQEFMQ